MTTAAAVAQDTAATLPQARIAKLPAAFFGAVMGLVGLGLAWRSAARVFGVPPLIGELILALGAAAFVLLAAFYTGRAGSLPAPLREQVVCRAKQNELKPRALAPRAEDKSPRTILRKVNVLSAP
jgi:hypothetical protein